MKDKKSLISKCLLGGGLLALICGIFCFFGSALTMSYGETIPGSTFMGMTMSISNLFSFMFGSAISGSGTITMGSETTPIPAEVFESATVNAVGITTAVFAIEMVIIVLAVILLIGIFAKKLQKKHVTIGCGIVCVLALVGVILAFCSKKALVNDLNLGGMELPAEIYGYFKLGSAQISYGVLGIVGILATGAGLFLGKDEAVAA